MAELIVLRALMRIGKHRIRFGYFLEFFLCLLVAWVAVGVMLQREFAVSLLNFFFPGIAVNTEQLVIVLFAVQDRRSFGFQIFLCISKKAPLPRSGRRGFRPEKAVFFRRLFLNLSEVGINHVIFLFAAITAAAVGCRVVCRLFLCSLLLRRSLRIHCFR